MRVVSALIKKGNRYLIGQRSFKKPAPGLWEMPGGKVDELPNGSLETDETALIREMKEELGVEVKVGKKVWESTITEREDHSYPVALYECEIISGSLKLNVHEELVYRTLSDIEYLCKNYFLGMPSKVVIGMPLIANVLKKMEEEEILHLNVLNT